MDRKRSGIIGTGFIGGVHAAAVRAAGGVVQAVASATPEAGPAAPRTPGTQSTPRIQVWT